MHQAKFDIRATTYTNTSSIDWIPIESQGKIASPPPLSLLKTQSKIAGIGPKKGPEGTVPVLQVTAEYLVNLPKKQPCPMGSESTQVKRQNSGKHWYVNSNLRVPNLGGAAVINLWKPYLQSDSDFSPLQTAITRDSSKGIQTFEIGWQHYPNRIREPHLFTFFTTNGYSNYGDYIMGYNQDVKGWVQVDTEIFPGIVVSGLSVDGGAQTDMPIAGYLFEGNWWVQVFDKWIGYYPASLWSNAVSGGDSLAKGADNIAYYGEIYNNEQSLTTTDMGSGRFANAGHGHAAYIKNMRYTDTKGFMQPYPASFGDSDSSRYSHMNAQNDVNWGSYVYIGGPGAGGVTGG